MRRPSVKQLTRWLDAMEQHVQQNPDYLPILERIEDELAIARRRESARQVA